MDIKEIDLFENTLIEKFRCLEIFSRLNEIKDSDLHNILLQRRFLSYCFTIVYDFAIDALNDPYSKIIARKILREEYPGESGRLPSHREDLFHDLIRIGIDRSAILSSTPSAQTLENINDTIQTLIGLSGSRNPELKLLTFIRFWGEVLVSVEYEHYWKVLEPKFKDNPSSFYLVHLRHDKKVISLDNINSMAASHADKLSLQMMKFLRSSNADGIEDFKDIEEKVLQLKSSFYNQFSI